MMLALHGHQESKYTARNGPPAGSWGGCAGARLGLAADRKRSPAGHDAWQLYRQGQIRRRSGRDL